MWWLVYDKKNETNQLSHKVSLQMHKDSIIKIFFSLLALCLHNLMHELNKLFILSDEKKMNFTLDILYFLNKENIRNFILVIFFCDLSFWKFCLWFNFLGLILCLNVGWKWSTILFIRFERIFFCQYEWD